MSSTTLTQKLRFALRQLGARNGQYEFENLCRHLARVTIAKNILPATGPVGSGGDRGRDFETHPTQLPDQVRPEGADRGISDGDAISFACTLQQRGIRSKIMDDVEKTTSQGPPVDWVGALGPGAGRTVAPRAPEE